MRIPNKTDLERSTSPVYGKELKIKLTKDLVYWFGKLCIVVPKGFVSDGTSTPKLMWIFFDRFDPRFLAGAILHDYLLVTDFLDRSTADQFFRMVLKKTAGFPLWLVYFIGVRIGTLNSKIKHKKYPQAKLKAKKLMQ